MFLHLPVDLGTFEGGYLCTSMNKFISTKLLCDGFNDCRRGEDEGDPPGNFSSPVCALKPTRKYREIRSSISLISVPRFWLLFQNNYNKIYKAHRSSGLKAPISDTFHFESPGCSIFKWNIRDSQNDVHLVNQDVSEKKEIV